jgi:ketosteroid isomerase-like protein
VREKLIMRCDAEGIVVGLYAAWRIQDVAATLAFCHDDIRYTVHQPAGITGIGAKIVGKVALRSYLTAVCAAWEFQDFQSKLSVIEHCPIRSTIRELVKFRVCHRQSGLPLEGHKRHVWRVDSSRVMSCDEYQDAPQLDAFLRMAKATTV